jgi:hypothetical protein
MEKGISNQTSMATEEVRVGNQMAGKMIRGASRSPKFIVVLICIQEADHALSSAHVGFVIWRAWQKVPVISSGKIDSRTSRSSFCSSTPMVAEFSRHPNAAMLTSQTTLDVRRATREQSKMGWCL